MNMRERKRELCQFLEIEDIIIMVEMEDPIFPFCKHPRNRFLLMIFVPSNFIVVLISVLLFLSAICNKNGRENENRKKKKIFFFFVSK